MGFLTGLGSLLLSVFTGFVGSHFNAHKYLMDAIFSLLPAQWVAPVQQLIDAFSVADDWLALGFLFQCVFLYLQAWVSFVSIKMTLKLIPFIG